jgi:hypothetical protein
MAGRIEERVVRGEIDHCPPGRVVGKIWLAGRDEAVELELEGNPWRDLAGHRLKFTNPEAKPADGARLAAYQHGVVGDMTASRKVKIPDCSMEEFKDFYLAKQPFPWHWGNSLYLEWFSQTNGRVVIDVLAQTEDLLARRARCPITRRMTLGFSEAFQSRNFPGLRMPLGSSACLRLRWVANETSPSAWRIQRFFARPTPCSPVIAPP